ncbi:hypothetical protein Mpet_1181 [Methanolacinia petrolearia DSM 11571]|uniref:Uncharacterized protein n=1 Tax=Methanolacinia petrolearia (strain DSM 11571 / OCM 486 / SEBR 4847) TaxID=679926 RepID=E1RDJ1_METP4|nr:hypothetical protein [Methanolacinia petrolearia]ADN35944.1 hypothetical protein Mpet_1181 [Methanolacinia petrolearia DSM 11571]
MPARENDVLSEAERLSDVLKDAKEKMSPPEFLLLLIEVNLRVEEITKIDYASVCVPSCGCSYK